MNFGGLVRDEELQRQLTAAFGGDRLPNAALLEGGTAEERRGTALLLARAALAHKRCDLLAARDLLEELLVAYPNGAQALVRQVELPDGEFARLRVNPYSEDELILAISEGIVLLQEGNDRAGRGALGSWVAGEVSRISPDAAREAARVSRQEGVQRP